MISTDEPKPNWRRVDRLLGKGKENRPYIRRFDLQKDMWLLWANYDTGGFESFARKLDKQAFTDQILRYIAVWSSLWLIEDHCKWFERKRGPTGMVCLLTDGWKVEPHFEFFTWATPRLKLRGMVSFLNMAAKSKHIGVCIGRAPLAYTKMVDHIKHRYRLCTYIGKIPNGGPMGDEYIYSLRGGRELTKER